VTATWDFIFTPRSSRHPGIGDLLPGIDRDLTAIFWG
jgi:hypothetical protein